MIGFVGLGNIGGAMAARLDPADLLVHDVREEAATALVERGARFATLKELAVECDVISVVVLTDAQVRDVVGQLLEHATAGTVIAVHSTIETRTAGELASTAPPGVHVLDAPVSGGAIGAADGRLAVMVGGEREAYEKAKPVFAHWASLVLHMGPAGAGTQTKLARNLLTFASFVVAAEASSLAESCGLDLGKLAAVVRHSDAVTGGPSAVMIRRTTGPFADDDGLRTVFEHTRTLGEKDLALALALGASRDVELPFARLALDHLAAALGVPHEELT
ncbi:MAG TPA: NAD(P)-dependent oxidoreductase [Mycobacteriales bacterium]|nr:NAD(P)-dependent oxidoreductase [Mycobacteriales bacterium]